MSAQHLQISLHTPEISEKLLKSPIYIKDAIVTAREVTIPEEVHSILSDGSLESTRIAQIGDFIVTNPTGEEFVLDRKTFLERHQPTGNSNEYLANGFIRAIPNPYGQQIHVKTVWGEQSGSDQCMIAAIFDPKEPEKVSEDRYLIGLHEFRGSYRISG